MNPFTKALRLLASEEIKALLEKLDDLDPTDSSYPRVREYVKNANVSFIERRLLRGAIKKLDRREARSEAMHLVIYGKSRRQREFDDHISSGLAYGSAPIKAEGTSITTANAISGAIANEIRKRVEVRRQRAGS